jgi:hypothetical protein
MLDCWNAVYCNSLVRDVSITGYRMEISFEFLGCNDGGAASLKECLQAVAWYFQDAISAFRALASRTAEFHIKQRSAQQLLQEIDAFYAEGVQVFSKKNQQVRRDL